MEKPRAPLRPCQSHLRKSEWGFGSLQGFIRTRLVQLPLPGRKRRKKKEGEINKRGNDQRVRAREWRGRMSDQRKKRGERQQETERGEKLTRRSVRQAEKG